MSNKQSSTITLMDGTQQSTNEGGSWEYNPGDTVAPGITATASRPAVAPAPSQQQPTPSGSISWTASEFVAHQKSGGWYGLLALAAILTAAGIWLITRDAVSSVVILFAAFVFGFYAKRQPRELDYQLDADGLTIAQKLYPYGGFRSFAVMDEGAFSSVVFMPLKRFAPLVTIYYAPEDEEQIVALLSDRLPMEDRKKDAIDRLMWRIRF